MAQVLVRNLDNRTVDRLKARARRNGRSLEAELRKIIEAAASQPSTTGDEATTSHTDRDDTWSVLERVAARMTELQLPKKRTPLRDVEPIRIKGKRISESMIEDRE